MTTCDAIRPRLEEFFDRELPAAEAAEVRAHVRSCPVCAEELKHLERLEQTLLAAPAGDEPPAWDDFLAGVKERTAARRPLSWAGLPFLAAAACLMLALTWMFARTGAPDASSLALVEAYATGDAAARSRLEKEAAALGQEGVAALVGIMLADPNAERQIAAAALLKSKASDPRVRDLLVRRSEALAREDAREWTLSEIGVERSDEEMVGPALELARHESSFADAVKILRRIDRGGFGSAHKEIVRRLRELMASDLPADQVAGFRVVQAMEILEGDVVEFLDVPPLRDEARKFLKSRTGKDYGFDKEAWARHFAARGM